MGFLDAMLGGRRRLKAPAPDRLFAISTAQVTLEAELGMKHRDVAGIVFQALATADFKTLLNDTDELVKSQAGDTGTTVESSEDSFGFRWVVLRDPDFEDLVVTLNAVSSELEAGGYGDRLLCAVFAFEDDGRPLYFIYNFKRGTFYPFVPTGEHARDNERELRLQAQLGADLPFERELDRWHPLWEIPI